ncbi:hypothetical protein BCR43DRAFT_481130 [Syncephalastrum racemosum]|uniref:Up-regulated during septation protein 1 domain-containing protein n=1 Tax=Syncephalastrum racemosum TaxID=13706 RepID=A0A1X2HRH0_SYNRA|nr:hypothetical protein BCR43DRAFT_481130 [Syncephalastrum racemosum]
MNRTTQKTTTEDNAKFRPIINYKLKDNPFFEKKQDAKKEQDSNSNKKVTPTTSNSGVTKKTWSPSNTPDRNKQVRASVQKMASSSTVSSNPWKSQQVATTARKPPTMARKTSIVKKPSLLKKEADDKRQQKEEESPGQSRILASSFSQPQSSTVAKKKTSTSSLRSTGSNGSSDSSKKSDSLSTGVKRLSSAKTPTAATSTSATTDTSSTQKSKPLDKVDAQSESPAPSASITTSRTVPRSYPNPKEVEPTKTEPGSSNPSSSSSSSPRPSAKPATSVSSIAKALQKETPAQPSPIRPSPSTTSTLQRMVEETEKEFTSSSSGRTSVSSNASSPSDYETLDEIRREHATPFTPPSTSPRDKQDDLPWGKYAPTTPSTQPAVDTQATTTTCDAEAMQRQLAVSHAVLTSLDFPTLTMDEAERLHKKHTRAKSGLTKIRDQMLLETHMQRSMLSLIKFSGPHQDILQLQDSTKTLDQLAQELYYTASDACESQKHYFQHLAGTLANTVQQEQEDPWGPSAQGSPTQNRDTPQQQQQPRQLQQQQQQQQQQRVLRQQRDAIRELRTEQEQLLNRLDTLVRAYASSSSHVSYPAGTGSLSDDESASLSDESLLFSKSVRTSLTSVDDDRRPLQPLSLATQLIDALEHQLQRASSQPAARAPAAPATAASSLSLADTQKLQEQQKRIADLEAKLADSEQKRQRLEQREAAWQADQKAIVSKCQYALADESSTDTAVTLVQRLVERNDTAMRCVNDLEHQLEEQTTREAELVQQVAAAQGRATAAETKAKAHAKAQQEAQSKSAVPAPAPAPVLAETALPSSQATDIAKLEALFKNAQEEFTRREAALMLQSASVEAELGAILKEYDRLTRNITDFHHERKKHETKELAWTRERQRLEKQLADFTIRDKLGMDGQSMTLRREFRQLMATVKSEHQQELEKEMASRRQLEGELRDMKHDLELKRWDKVDAAVQTPFIAYYHHETHPLH